MHRPTYPIGSRRGRLDRALAMAAAAVVVVVSLTACRADQVGTAAIVDGDSISVEELQDATEGYLQAVPNASSGDAQQAILQQLIVSAVIQKAADIAGVTVTDSEVAQQRDQVLDSVREPAAAAEVSARDYVSRQLAQGQTGAVVPPDDLEQFIRDQLLATKLGENDPAAANDALVAAARETDVEVNPRYGRWDPQQGLAPLVSGGLSKTVEELSGGADQQQ
jgi:hypothetical protein